MFLYLTYSLSLSFLSRFSHFLPSFFPCSVSILELGHCWTITFSYAKTLWLLISFGNLVLVCFLVCFLFWIVLDCFFCFFFLVVVVVYTVAVVSCRCVFGVVVVVLATSATLGCSCVTYALVTLMLPMLTVFLLS